MLYEKDLDAESSDDMLDYIARKEHETLDEMALRRGYNFAEWRKRLCKWAERHKIPTSTLPRDSEALQALTELDLRDSNISELPPEIGMLENLQTLNLDNNLLTDLPDEIERLVNLNTITLSNNRLGSRPKVLARLPYLSMVKIENNYKRQSVKIEAFNFLCGDVAHKQAGVREEDESNLLNRDDRRKLTWPRRMNHYPCDNFEKPSLIKQQLLELIDTMSDEELHKVYENIIMNK